MYRSLKSYFACLLQLDVQTKLCIRDGLYRLARSAQHRQVIPNMMSSNEDNPDIKDLQNAETLRKYDISNKDLIYTYTSMNQYLYGFEKCSR